MGKAARRRGERNKEYARPEFLPPLRRYLLVVEGYGRFNGTFNEVYAKIEDLCGTTARVKVNKKSYEIFGRVNATLKRM